MMTFDFLGGALFGLIETGGWVVALQVAMSVLGLAALFWKLWQFRRAGVGRHRDLEAALAANDAATWRMALARSRSGLAAPVRDAQGSVARVEAEMAAHIAGLERGFRLFDTIAQLAPLLGLFGTVLGMIAAFQAMQAAGNATDPAVLAGGIWVALLTTAVGLAVGMPASVVLNWFESRVAGERVMANRLIAAVPARRPVSRESEGLRDAA